MVKYIIGLTGMKALLEHKVFFIANVSRICKQQLKLNQAIKRTSKKKECNTPAIQSAIPEAEAEPEPSSLPRTTRDAVGKLHVKELCIWCMKPDETRKNKRKTSANDRFHRIEQRKSWHRFCSSIVHLEDDEMRRRILAFVDTAEDPFAADIYYHKKCWDRYIYNATKTNYHIQNVSSTEVTAMFIQHVQTVVFDYNEPRTLKGLLLDYKNILAEFGQEAKEIKTSYIKTLLAKEFGDSIGFHDRYQKNESTLVFDATHSGSFVESAINCWGLSLEQLLWNVAHQIHAQAQHLPKMQWPPTVEEACDRIDENFLTSFVGLLKNSNTKETKYSPNVHAISSILQSLITGKRTKFQLQLTSIVYGLTRNRELVDILKKMGLGVSYQDIKNLYATWAKFDMEKSCAPPEIAENHPAVVIMDNDDFKSDTLTGSSLSNHRTNVMFVQNECLRNEMGPSSERPSMITHGALKEIVEDLNKITPYKTIKPGEPSIRPSFNIQPSSTTDIRSDEILHTLVRIDKAYENIQPCEQQIGSFAGFQSLLYDSVTKSKPYYWLTFPKPPHKSVVHEVMIRALDVIKEKDIPFLILTGDQPVYTLIVQLRNENKEKFAKIIPMLGPFHTQVAFITAISKRFEGSGLSDIFVSAAIIADKSVDQAMRGKHFRRIVRALQLMYEALQRRIIRRGVAGLNFPEEIKTLLDNLRNPHVHSKEDLRKAVKCEFQAFINDSYNNIENTPMADYWLSFMYMVEILTMNINSLKTQNWEQFKDSLRLMIPWLQIYDKVHYGKWLPEFWTEMSTLPSDVDSQMKSIFSHSITGKPYSSIATDLWIEMTMNKGSKMKAGWQRILKNETMLCTHTRNANYVNQLRMSLHDLASLKRYDSRHKENTPTRLRLDELGVHDLDSCILEFDCDPFDSNNTRLRTLQSGEYASQELEEDLLSAQEDGEAMTLEFFNEKIFSRVKEWGISRKNRRTFLNLPDVDKSSKAKCNTAQMENEAMSRVISECCGKNITLTDIMEHRITTECLSLFNTNGTIIKNQKSKLLQTFSFLPLQYEQLLNCAALIDMGFIWRLCTPTTENREKGDGSHFTWRDYAKKIYNTIITRHSTASTIILVNDPYNVEESIKAGEHARRKSRAYVHGSQNVFIRPLEKLPNATQLSNFFTNKSNKICLQDFLKDEFRRLSQSTTKDIIYCAQKVSEDITDGTRVAPYECYHQEADTILFYVSNVLRESGFTDAIVIDAEDTDVVVQSALVSNEIEGMLAIRKKSATYDCKRLCTSEIASVIVQIHILTGADATSGFFGKGKKTVIKNAIKDIEGTKQLLGNFGETLELPEDVIKNVIMFVIRFVYNDKKSSTLAESRVAI